MQIIGKGIILWDEFEKHVSEEAAHAKMCEPGWYVTHRSKLDREIDNLVWKGMYKIGEGSNYPIAVVSAEFQTSLKKHDEYLKGLGLQWDVLYYGETVAVIRSGKFTAALPTYTIKTELYENLESYTLGELRGRIGVCQEHAIVKQDGISMAAMKKNISSKQAEIENVKDKLQKLQEEKELELQRLKKELEARFAEKTQIIEQKKAELENKIKILKGQMFLLDTELYSLRCFMGETVDFVKLCSGITAALEEPIVFYQKIRYLDEELGKWLALYGVDGDDCKYFEQILQNRGDLRELFAPGPKSISLVKVSKNSIHYSNDPFVANCLREYDTFHGKTIGILIRDGENLYIGWTDEDRINISDENAFLKPVNKEESMENGVVGSSKEEIASRYFLFHILQGLAHKNKILTLPEGVDFFKPNPYVVMSMADGWLEDERFGTFADIVKRTEAPLAKGDMVLTTIRITRDDAYTSSWSNKSTRDEAWNNDRGRGDKNRTHDAFIPNCKVVPINLIDKYQIYTGVFKKYKLDVRWVEEKNEEGIIYNRTETYKTDEYLGEISYDCDVINNSIYGKYGNIKGLSIEEVGGMIRYYGYFREEERINPIDEEKSYYEVYDRTELKDSYNEYFISAKKTDSNYWGDGKDAYANMQIFSDEYINLTFLNSVYISYVINSRKIGNWHQGKVQMDYAGSLKYLNTALQYLRNREKTEAAMLEKYMDLYTDWQIDLSEWRLKNNYHRLTDTRAKKFAIYKKKEE